MKYINILLLTLIIQSCSKTEKTKYLENIEVDERLASISANIYITDDNHPEKLSAIELNVYDGGRFNSKNTILLNNQPFILETRKSNYYKSYSSYKLKKYKKDEAYLFEIILEDSSRHTLAYIKPRKDYMDLNYIIPKHFSSDENLELKWENIYIPTELRINKETYERKHPQYILPKTHEYGYKITNKSASYIIDKSAFSDSLEVTVEIKARFIVREKGRINPNLSSGSLIYINRLVKKSILKSEKAVKINLNQD